MCIVIMPYSVPNYNNNIHKLNSNTYLYSFLFLVIVFLVLEIVF